jgi:hypothetical protein
MSFIIVEKKKPSEKKSPERERKRMLPFGSIPRWPQALVLFQECRKPKRKLETSGLGAVLSICQASLSRSHQKSHHSERTLATQA